MPPDPLRKNPVLIPGSDRNSASDGWSQPPLTSVGRTIMQKSIKHAICVVYTLCNISSKSKESSVTSRLVHMTKPRN